MRSHTRLKNALYIDRLDVARYSRNRILVTTAVNSCALVLSEISSMCNTLVLSYIKVPSYRRAFFP